MIKLSLLIFMMILVLVFYACKRDKYSGPTSVHGFVVSENDGRRISGADVWLVNSGGSSALSNKVVLYKKSNADGYYNFDFDADESSTYYIATEAEHYYKKDNFYNFSKGKNNKLDLPIIPKGYIKIILIDELPVDYLHNFSINYMPNPPRYIKGDTAFYSYFNGNQKLSFNYSFIKTAVTNYQRYDTTIFVKALDTVDFTIKY